MGSRGPNINQALYRTEYTGVVFFLLFSIFSPRKPITLL
jgi:hypothetical protein